MASKLPHKNKEYTECYKGMPMFLKFKKSSLKENLRLGKVSIGKQEVYVYNLVHWHYFVYL